MGLNIEYGDGQTVLDEEEKEGLRITTINSHKELDEYEQRNIEKALEWVISKKVPAQKLLTEEFIKLLHKKMFSDVWKWAGVFRKTEKNIGADWVQIGITLKALLDDTIFWIDYNIFSPDEIAIKFKHRLVSIHCFANGNGRHSRLMADLIIEKVFEKKVFTWNSSRMNKPNETRSQYIKALQDADNGNIEPLINFAKN